MIWLTARENVYTDSSLMGYYVILELKIFSTVDSLYPRKSFRVDAFPFPRCVGAEETFLVAARSARTAVPRALRPRRKAPSPRKGLELARLYLHTMPQSCMEKRNEHPANRALAWKKRGREQLIPSSPECWSR